MLERLIVLYYFLRYRLRRPFPTRAKLEAWQRRRLRRHLRFVRARSTFYRARLLHGWAKAPLVDKQVMMSNFDTLNTAGLRRDEVLAVAGRAERDRDFAPQIGGVTVGLSSGTSGHRGIFCANRRERLRYAGLILAKALPPGGLLRRQRVAFFLRANSNLYKTVGGRRLRFEYFDLLDDPATFAPRVEALQPTLIVAPPSLLRALADQIAAGQLRLKTVSRVYSVAEVLDPLDQLCIERAFAQPVHQIYQCTEGFLAISCAHGTLHLNEDLAIIEKEWIDGAHHKFTPIITDLYRSTQPVIRYRLNDILTEDPRPCPCGAVTTRLKMIEGRHDDMIELRRGGRPRAVFPDFLRAAIVDASTDIEEYVVTQRPDLALSVALRTAPGARDVEARVRVKLKDLAARLDCDAPAISFDHAPALERGVKLRRIRRLRAADHPPS